MENYHVVEGRYFLPRKKVHNGQKYKRWNWEISALKLREKTQGLSILTSIKTVTFKSRILPVNLTNLLNLVKITNLLKETIYTRVQQPEIGSKAIETIQDGPFGRVVETGL